MSIVKYHESHYATVLDMNDILFSVHHVDDVQMIALPSLTHLIFPRNSTLLVFITNRVQHAKVHDYQENKKIVSTEKNWQSL